MTRSKPFQHAVQWLWQAVCGPWKVKLWEQGVESRRAAGRALGEGGQGICSWSLNLSNGSQPGEGKGHEGQEKEGDRVRGGRSSGHREECAGWEEVRESVFGNEAEGSRRRMVTRFGGG
jgi:hypothetical protein